MSEIGVGLVESGVGLVVEWKIENFFNLPEEDGAWYWSPTFFFGGDELFLRIWPNGWRECDSSEYVDLRLYKRSTDRSIKQSFSLSLKTAKEEKYNEQNCTKDFGRIYPENYHALLRFTPRLELTRRRSELAPDGDVTVICMMKSSTSAESASNAASAECCHCKGTFNAGNLSSHQKKCMHRPVKCPDCLEVVVLQKWFDKHECQQEQERPEGATCGSGHSTSQHEKKVLRDFKELFLQKEGCDVIIKVKGSEFPVHRFVLKARSPVFASTFRHNMKESATNIVEIDDCDPSSFLDFLCFLYCGDVGRISKKNVISLFIVADKYEVLGLKAECLEFLKRNITVDTFCETITLALQHSEIELIALATDFFVGNAEEILLTVKWQTFVAENPTQSDELIIKFVRSVTH